MGRGDDQTIRRVLDHQIWAVVGLSTNQLRPAYGVARFLRQRGKTVVPINPAGESHASRFCAHEARCLVVEVRPAGLTLSGFVQKMGMQTDASGFVATAAKWFVRLIVLTIAFDALGLPAVSQVLQQ